LSAKTKRLAVVELLDRKSSNCPLTVVHSQDEYRLVDQIRVGVAKNPGISGLYRWDAADALRDLIIEERPVPDLDDRTGSLAAIQWFLNEPSPMKMKQEGVDETVVGMIFCPRSKTIASEMLEDLGGAPRGSILIMFDAIATFSMADVQKSGYTNTGVCRLLKNNAGSLIQQQKSVFIVNHRDDLPPELEGFCPVIKHEGPTRNWLVGEIRKACSIGIHGNDTEIPKISLNERQEEGMVGELKGLTSVEVREALALANRTNAQQMVAGMIAVADRRFDLESIRAYKSTALKRSNAMRIVPPVEGGFSVVGGMGSLKDEILTTVEMIKQGAYDDGIPHPKGLLMVGSGGTGKSLVAKAIGSIMDRQMVCLDVSACKGSLVGESEGKFRRALEIADQMAPVVLFLDEFEKVWGGAEQANDSGVSSGMLQTWLNWMQDWKDPGVFVVAACNDIRGIPGPVVRAGRFDDIVYVPLPGPVSRKEILKIHLGKTGWASCVDSLDLDLVVEATKGFSGAELERVVTKAIKKKILRAGVGRDKPVETIDLMLSVDGVVPTSQTHGEEIESLYRWAMEAKVIVASDEELDFEFEAGKMVPRRKPGRTGRKKSDPPSSGENRNVAVTATGGVDSRGDSDELY